MQRSRFENVVIPSQRPLPQRLTARPGGAEARRLVGIRARSAREAGFQAVQTIVRSAVSFGARGELHELDVDDAGGADFELGVERFGIHAHVEEASGDRGVFEDGFQGVFAVGAEGGECAVFEEVQVDDMCMGVVGGVDL